MTNNRRSLVGATVVACVVLFASGYFTTSTYTEPVSVEKTVETVELSGPLLPVSLPQRLRIPKVQIDTVFSAPVGIDEQTGEVSVPEDYDSVAYYQHGPTPGELGPAVVLGHVDSHEGPAVFFSIGQLEVGDEVYVDREDGSVATFAVTKLTRTRQTGFPTAEVYGDINHAGLRLITCTGIYDKDKLRYTHNLIVFAELVATSTATGE